MASMLASILVFCCNGSILLPPACMQHSETPGKRLLVLHHSSQPSPSCQSSKKWNAQALQLLSPSSKTDSLCVKKYAGTPGGLSRPYVHHNERLVVGTIHHIKDFICIGNISCPCRKVHNCIKVLNNGETCARIKSFNNVLHCETAESASIGCPE